MKVLLSFFPETIKADEQNSDSCPQIVLLYLALETGNGCYQRMATDGSDKQNGGDLEAIERDKWMHAFVNTSNFKILFCG